MNTIQRFGLGMMGLLLLGLADPASAATTTGKVTFYSVWPNTTSGAAHDSYYGFLVGGNKVSTGNRTMGEFMREAFMRKLTVTLEYTPCYGPPPLYTQCFSLITSATLQSTDVP